MKLISSFSKCHGVCSNNCKVASVINILVLHVHAMGKFLPIEEEIDKLGGRRNMFPFFFLNLCKGTIVITFVWAFIIQD